MWSMTNNVLSQSSVVYVKTVSLGVVNDHNVLSQSSMIYGDPVSLEVANDQ